MFSIDMARIELSDFLIPSARMASPCFLMISVMNLFDGLIFRRDVHHLNIGLGAGYPLPMRLTQNESSGSGVRRSSFRVHQDGWI